MFIDQVDSSDAGKINRRFRQRDNNRNRDDSIQKSSDHDMLTTTSNTKTLIVLDRDRRRIRYTEHCPSCDVLFCVIIKFCNDLQRYCRRHRIHESPFWIYLHIYQSPFGPALRTDLDPVEQ